MDESYSPSTTGNDPLIGSGDNRKGKTRTSINPKQLVVLQATYEKEPRPSRAMREELAAQTGLTAKVIQVWFQNRRSKDKKDGTKGEPGMIVVYMYCIVLYEETTESNSEVCVKIVNISKV